MSDESQRPDAAGSKATKTSATRLRVVSAALAIPGAHGVLFGVVLWASAHFQCEPAYGSQIDTSCGVTQMWTPVAISVIITSAVAVLVGVMGLIAAAPSQYGSSSTAGEAGSAGEGAGDDWP